MPKNADQNSVADLPFGSLSIDRFNLRPLVWVAGVCLFFIALALYRAALTNNDVAWLLTGTEKWLTGAKLYSTVVEVNPPLIFYLNVVPVLLSHLFGISAETIFVYYIFFLTLTSCVLVALLVGDLFGTPTAKDLFLVGCLAACVAFAAFDFGQREQFVVILSLPYIVGAARRAERGSLAHLPAACAGILAAISFAMKPQFLIVPVAIELYLMATTRSRRVVLRPEIIAGLSTLMAYVLAVVLFQSEYLLNVVPKAFLVYNAGYSNSWITTILKWQSLLLVVTAMSHVMSRKRQSRPALADLFFIASSAFYIVYLTQLKGWSYQLIPVTAFAFLGTLAAILTGGRPALGFASLCGLLILPMTLGFYHNKTAEVLAPIIQSRAQHSAIFVFSSYVWVGFPLATIVEARWPSRFPALWTLPGAEKKIAAARASGDRDQLEPLLRLEQYTIDSVVDDFRKDMPAIVIVDRRVDPRFGNVKFDYLQFFGRDSRFLDLWSEYVWESRVEQDGIGPFDLYIRKSILHPNAK